MFDFDEYLSNFDDSSKDEIKLLLENYVETLREIGYNDKSNDIKHEISKFF